MSDPRQFIEQVIHLLPSVTRGEAAVARPLPTSLEPLLRVWEELDHHPSGRRRSGWSGLIQQLELLNAGRARRTRAAMRMVSVIRTLSSLADLIVDLRPIGAPIEPQAARFKHTANALYARVATPAIFANPLAVTHPTYTADVARLSRDIIQRTTDASTLDVMTSFRDEETWPLSIRYIVLVAFSSMLSRAASAVMSGIVPRTTTPFPRLIRGALTSPGESSPFALAVECAELAKDMLGPSGFVLDLIKVAATADLLDGADDRHALRQVGDFVRDALVRYAHVDRAVLEAHIREGELSEARHLVEHQFHSSIPIHAAALVSILGLAQAVHELHEHPDLEHAVDALSGGLDVSREVSEVLIANRSTILRAVERRAPITSAVSMVERTETTLRVLHEFVEIASEWVAPLDAVARIVQGANSLAGANVAGDHWTIAIGGANVATGLLIAAAVLMGSPGGQAAGLALGLVADVAELAHARWEESHPMDTVCESLLRSLRDGGSMAPLVQAAGLTEGVELLAEAVEDLPIQRFDARVFTPAVTGNRDAAVRAFATATRIRLCALGIPSGAAESLVAEPF